MKIDVFQDTVCPWCRIGKTHLMQALEQISIDPIEINYRAFLLDPTRPPEEKSRSTLIERLGGKEQSDAMHNQLCEVGEACGLQFNVEEIEQILNTILSHQLIKLTQHHQQQANDQYGLSGAQPVDTFVQALKQIEEGK